MYFGGGFAKSKKTGKIFNEQIYLNLFLKIFEFFFLILAVFSLKKIVYPFFLVYMSLISQNVEL